MRSDFNIKWRDESLMGQMVNGGKPLQSLCLKEAEAFNDFLMEYAGSGDKGAEIFVAGLANWEKQAIAGYLYQKVRGRF